MILEIIAHFKEDLEITFRMDSGYFNEDILGRQSNHWASGM